MFIARSIEPRIKESLVTNPVTALIGPRQCGKTTLARKLVKDYPNSIYLDLERPSDLARLENAELFLQAQRGKLICLDEIQRKPDIFPLIRSLIDEWGGVGHFLILGSASVQLLRQSSESLAGRIAYHTLAPFLYNEIGELLDIHSYMITGGYPRSALSKSIRISENWKNNFILSYVERDLLQWGGVSSTTMYRLWKMLAHINGQIVNHSHLGNSLGVSSVTIKTYIALLSNTFMLKQISPYLPNIGKRLIKSPKIYLSDPGLACTLLEINSIEQLLGNPVFGSLWETLILNQLHGSFPGITIYHYRTSQGNELDFVIELSGRRIALECKASLSPHLTKGNHSSINDIEPVMTFVVAPVNEGWPLSDRIRVVNIFELLEELKPE